MEKILENSSAARMIMVALALVLTVYVAALAFNTIKSSKFVSRPAGGQSTITVSGSGDVYVQPDLALMDFSVVSDAATVAAAMDDNTKKMNAIIDVVKSLGVAENDTQTSGFNVEPRYDNVKETTPACTPDYCPAPVIGKQVLAGYRVTQTLSLRMKKEVFGKIGQIIQEATAAGANLVGNLQFTLENPNVAQDQARDTAIKDAKTKAQTLAKQLGVKLARISGYGEGGYAPAYRLSYAAKDVAAGVAEGAPAPNIQAGENKITVSVSITYDIE